MCISRIYKTLVFQEKNRITTLICLYVGIGNKDCLKYKVKSYGERTEITAPTGASWRF